MTRVSGCLPTQVPDQTANGLVLTSDAYGVVSWQAQTGGGSSGTLPLTTKGDLLYENATPANARLAIGSTGQVLAVAAGLPAWTSVSALTASTTSAAGVIQLDGTGADFQALGTAAAAGANGLAADSGHVHPNTGVAMLSGATFTGYVAPAVGSLTFGGTISVNAAAGNAFYVTLTSSAGSLANPSNGVDGQVIRVRVIQDGSGSRTLAYGGSYDFGAAGAPTLSTGASKVDILGFEYVASLSKWCYLGSALGN